MNFTQAVMNWQPIETAPRDGRHVILASVFYVGVGYFQQSGPIAERTWTMFTEFPLVCEPTHWMPFPDPPTLDASNKN